jgi:hypothetical protein
MRIGKDDCILSNNYKTFTGNYSRRRFMIIRNFHHQLILVILMSLPAFALTVQSPSTIGKYKVYEISITYSSTGLSNVWEDVDVTTDFVSPSSKQITVNGFYHSANTWKVRLAPWEIGTYSWTIHLKPKNSTEQAATGSFSCVASSEKGFIRTYAPNTYRMVYDDGSLFPALGWEMMCNLGVVNTATDSVWQTHWWFVSDTHVTVFNEYLKAFADTAHFNLTRIGCGNGFPDLFNTIATTGNVYKEVEGGQLDTMYMKLRAHNVRIYMDFFGYHPQMVPNWADPASMAAVQRYVKYIVARYGAYVDMWEILNEYVAPDGWIKSVAAYTKSIDPYKHMVSVSWEKPQFAEIDMDTPHWYQTECDVCSDGETVRMINQNKVYANHKPIIFE